MNFLILRLLTHSELGMFHAYRRSGREGSRQRAINFDGDVVDRVFPAAADADRIDLSLSFDSDLGLVKGAHSLKRQAKNWRLEGNCPDDALYAFVEPGCLFALQINSGVTPAVGGWVVFPKDDSTAALVLADGATSGLVSAGMIALEPEEGACIQRLLADVRPDVFTPPQWNSRLMTDSPAAAADPRRTLPPGPERLATILGDAGHTLVSAVADIIDNAITAHATEVDITFGPPNSGNGRWLSIRDNGDGMTRDELEEAMRIGGEARYGQRSLGKYGYGLKGASWSQARAFTVVTRPVGGPVSHLTWDRDDMADWKVKDGPLEAWETEAADPGAKGTVVLWKNMKTPTTNPAARGVSPHVAEIQELTRHLALVFHRFIEGEAKGRPQLTVRINEIPVEPNGPVSHPLALPYDAKTLKVPHGAGTADVRVSPYLLPSEDELKAHHAGKGPEASSRALERIGYYGRRNETQGLFIYRNDRLIRWGGWHDMWLTNDEKRKLARVLVDFDPALDESFQINISKQSVRLPGFLQAQIKELAEPVRKASQAKYLKPRPSPAAGEMAPSTPSPSGGSGPASPKPTAAAGPQPKSGDQGSGESPPAEGGSAAFPSPEPISIRAVTTDRFAWKISSSIAGGRSLQVSRVSPTLAALAEAIEADPEATLALAAFLEDLDGLDVQETMLADADLQ